jgi:hypothetical protein
MAVKTFEPHCGAVDAGNVVSRRSGLLVELEICAGKTGPCPKALV